MINQLRRTFIILFLFFNTLSVKAQDQSNRSAGPDKDKLLEFYETQRYSEASTYLEGFYNEATTDVKILTQLAYVHLMAGKLQEAEEIYLKLYAQQPTHLPVLFNLATIQVKRGNDEKARNYYKEIVAVDGQNFRAYKQLANLTKSYSLKEKLGYLEKANVINPAEADLAFDLSELYYNMKLYSKANAVLQPALKADTANLQLMKMELPIKIALKKNDEAIRTGLKLLSYGDSSTFVVNNLAKSYFQLLDYKSALFYFLKAAQDAEPNEGLLYNIALCQRGLRNYKVASEYLNQAIEAGISKKTASYYGLLGDSYENIKKNQEAITAYKRGLLFENNGSLYYNIALVYETKLNDKKSAITNYNLYLNNFKEMNANPKLAAFIKNKIEELKR